MSLFFPLGFTTTLPDFLGVDLGVVYMAFYVAEPRNQLDTEATHSLERLTRPPSDGLPLHPPPVAAFSFPPSCQGLLLVPRLG